MALAHVLLTSLLEKPSNGFELARRFDRSMGFFWHASHQQIYRELGLMLNKGWISTLESAQHGPQTTRKKTYQVEAAGLMELTRWTLEPSEPGQQREDLMVKLRASAQLPTCQLIDEMQRHLQLHLDKHAVYQTLFSKDFAQNTPPNRVSYIHKMILQLGIQQEQTWIDWLQQLIAELPQHTEQEP